MSTDVLPETQSHPQPPRPRQRSGRQDSPGARWWKRSLLTTGVVARGLGRSLSSSIVLGSASAAIVMGHTTPRNASHQMGPRRPRGLGSRKWSTPVRRPRSTPAFTQISRLLRGSPCRRGHSRLRRPRCSLRRCRRRSPRPALSRRCRSPTSPRRVWSLTRSNGSGPSLILTRSCTCNGQHGHRRRRSSAGPPAGP